jgi:hypothetical protein
LPLGLVPYSRWPTEVKLRAVQMSAWGYELLPVAGVVGVDEK